MLSLFNKTTSGRVSKTVQGACAAALMALLPTTAANAQQATDGVYISGAERIDIGERIRMQSQRITAMACMMDAGINVDENRETIQAAMTEVDALLGAMKDGDTSYNVTVAEDDRRMLEAIRGVKLQWERFSEAMDLRLAGVESSGPDYVSRQNLNLMHASKYLVSETVNRYAIPPALLQSDAFTLQIVARQRSLAQQLAKESCAIVTGNATMGSQARLHNSTKRFDASFNALINGFPAAGVSKPATPEIRAQLVAMSAEWAALRAELVNLGTETPQGKAEEINSALDAIMVQYDQIVPLYLEVSKSGL